MKSKSFTLIELLVVIVIIGILVGVIVVSTSNNITKAQDTKLTSAMLGLNKALKIYSLDSFPIETTACNIKTSCTNLKSKIDIPSIDQDIYYKTSPSGNFFVIYANKPSNTNLSFEINSDIEDVKEVPSFTNLVAYYPLSIGTSNGTTIADMSSNSNNGTMVNGPIFTEGKDGNMNMASGFNGTNNYIDSGNKNFDYNTFTVSVWSKCVTNNSTEPGFPIHVTNLVGEGNWNTLNDWYLGYYGTGTSPATRLSFGYGIGCCGAGPSYSVNSFDLSKWNHIVGVATEANQILYMNGVAVSTIPTTHVSVVNGYNFQIARSSYTDRFFKGSVDDVHIYNRALSAEEVKLLYNNGK